MYLLWSLYYFFRHIWLLGLPFFQLEPIVEVATILRDAQHVVPKLGWTISPFCYLGARLCLFVSITTGLWELRLYWSHHGYLEKWVCEEINAYFHAAREKVAAINCAYYRWELLKGLPHHQRDTALGEGGLHIHKSIQISSPGFALSALRLEEASQVAECLGAFVFSSCGHFSKQMAHFFQDQTAARTWAPGDKRKAENHLKVVVTKKIPSVHYE